MLWLKRLIRCHRKPATKEDLLESEARIIGAIKSANDPAVRRATEDLKTSSDKLADAVKNNQ